LPALHVLLVLEATIHRQQHIELPFSNLEQIAILDACPTHICHSSHIMSGNIVLQ